MWHRAGSLKWTMWVTDLLPDEKDFIQEKKKGASGLQMLGTGRIACYSQNQPHHLQSQ